MYSSNSPSTEEQLPTIGAIVSQRKKRSIDWRSKGKVSGVKNQGRVCNSCYAFVAVADI
jgi:C1A family cysteine protease